VEKVAQTPGNKEQLPQKIMRKKIIEKLSF